MSMTGVLEESVCSSSLALSLPTAGGRYVTVTLAPLLPPISKPADGALNAPRTSPRIATDVTSTGVVLAVVKAMAPLAEVPGAAVRLRDSGAQSTTPGAEESPPSWQPAAMSTATSGA
jgi:hypothetical protein